MDQVPKTPDAKPWPPSAFVHMPRDTRTAASVATDVELLKSQASLLPMLQLLFSMLLKCECAHVWRCRLEPKGGLWQP